MKTKEEIDEMYKKLYLSLDDSPHYHTWVKGYTQCQEDMLHDQTVTRFEVVDEKGRVYSQWNCKVELSYQDDGRTLKVFIKLLNKQD